MPSHAMTAGAKRDAERPRGLWLGPVRGGELGFVRDALRGRLDLVERDVVDDPSGPDGDWAGRGPDFVILASDRPGRWSLDTAAAAARRWPLATLFGVVTSLGEGRRRSGAGVPAIEEVAWHDLPGRLECWLDDLAVGRSGALAAPATARREERLLDAVDALVGPRPAGEAAPVTVAGGAGADLEGVADLLALAGRRVVGRTAGRPRLDTETPLLVWDVVAAGPADLAWLRMLAANRPGLGVVLLDSFPRGDATVAAVRSGAGAVLPRPVSLETLEGALRRLERAGPRFREGTGLGDGAGRR